MEIIERIYETLSKSDKKAYELCEKLNIRTSTMSTWKARTNDPPAKYMKTIADFLGVSLDYLLTGQEYARPLPRKRMNFWNCSVLCRNLRNMNLSGNSKAF